MVAASYLIYSVVLLRWAFPWLMTSQDNTTDPHESEDTCTGGQEKRGCVRNALQRLQQDLHWRDEENAEG